MSGGIERVDFSVPQAKQTTQKDKVSIGFELTKVSMKFQESDFLVSKFQ